MSRDTNQEPTANQNSGDALARLLNRPLTDEDLRVHTERVAQPLEKERKHGASVVLFGVGEEQLALPVLDVARITPVMGVHRIPHRTNEIVRGLCNIDGELVLCASLARLLGISDEATLPKNRASGSDASNNGRMLLIANGDHRWAFAVDTVDGVSYVEPDEVLSTPLTVDGALVKFTESMLRFGGAHAALLDTASILSGLKAALR